MKDLAMTQGHAFDVATVLGIGTPDSSPLPVAEEGEVVLRVAEGLSLVALHASEDDMMYWHPWYEKFSWCKEVIPAGSYRLRVLLPGSRHKTFAEQWADLSRDEQVAPVTLVAAALLCMQRSGQPAQGHDWMRCIEKIDSHLRAAVTWSDERVNIVGSSIVTRHERVGLSVLRTF